MTKLEEKLIELGYKNTHKTGIWYKDFDLEIMQRIIISDNKIYFNAVDIEGGTIINQKIIDNLQQAFNEMERDLKILKGVEDE